MVTAYFWLGEPIGRDKSPGAAAVLAGVALTRLGQQRLQIPDRAGGLSPVLAVRQLGSTVKAALLLPARGSAPC